MDKLIPDPEKEIDDIAIRIIVMKLENPHFEINGILASLKSHINHKCIEIGSQGGEHGKIWDEELRQAGEP